MPWARLDDKAITNRKLRKLSSDAFRVWVLGLVHCTQELTDGFIAADVLSMFPLREAALRKAVTELTTPQVSGKAALWSLAGTGDGYQVHDYLQWNASREDVLGRRETDKKRLQNWRATRGETADETPLQTRSVDGPTQPNPTTSPTETAPPALPRLKKADKEPESPILRLQLRYAEALAKNLGQENAELNWEKAGSIFKAALEKFDEATVRRVLEQFMADREPFLVERAWTIGLFRPRFNQYLGKSAESRSAPRLASEVLADERARAEAMFAEEQP